MSNPHKNLEKRFIDHSWDFASDDTKYYTHGIHPYPAMMIPQVSKRIISEYGQGALVALDPFCGAGSVLLELKLVGLDAYGIDINPLAALVAKVKTTPISPEILQIEWEKLQDNLKNKTNVKVPQFKNIDYWFKRPVIEELANIKAAIDKTENKNVRDFFLVAFSEAVRRSSNTRGGEFKLFRMAPEKLAGYHPIPSQIFKEVVQRNINAVESLFLTCKKINCGNVKVILGNTMADSSILPKSIDIVVTSPPYGDSRTTVAYGQFSRLSLQWLGFDDKICMQMDSNMLGGKPAQTLDVRFESSALRNSIKKIAELDLARAKEVVSFYIDFSKAAEQINKIMKDKSAICLVVGNRTVKGIKLPTDEIMVDIFRQFGYLHIKTIIRSIPSKRMPKRNSPTNVKGATVSTMNEEYIVILKRD